MQKIKTLNLSFIVRKNKKNSGHSIEERPENINDRTEFRHWEIDTVIGSKTKDDEVLLTLCERGTNERHNGLIRRFIPKSRRIDKYSVDEVAFIETVQQLTIAIYIN